MEDEAVISRVKQGDAAAFGEVVRHHAPAITAFLGRFLNHREDAEDLAQETFLRAYDRIHSYDPARGSFRNWLFRIAANLSLNEQRRRRRRAEREDMAASEGSIHTIPDVRDASDALRAREVRRCLHELPSTERQALLLVYYHEMGYREVGEVLGIPVGTVKSRVHSAITRLRRQLQPDREGASR